MFYRGEKGVHADFMWLFISFVSFIEKEKLKNFKQNHLFIVFFVLSTNYTGVLT